MSRAISQRELRNDSGQIDRVTLRKHSFHLGMMKGMERPKVKIAITLRPEIVEQVRARVAAGQARSVSAFIEHAVTGQLAAEADFDSLIAEMLAATGGPPTEEERAAARRLLSGSAA